MINHAEEFNSSNACSLLSMFPDDYFRSSIVKIWSFSNSSAIINKAGSTVVVILCSRSYSVKHPEYYLGKSLLILILNVNAEVRAIAGNLNSTRNCPSLFGM